MKTHYFIYLAVCSIILISCEKDKKEYKNYLEYLNNKNINSIVLDEDILWVFSSMEDFDPEQPSITCSIPMTYQITKANGNSFSYKEDIPYLMHLKKASDGKLYAIRMNEIVEIIDIGEYHKIYGNDTLYLNDFIINDKDIWFVCSEGLGYLIDNKFNLIREVEGIDITNTSLYIEMDNNGVIWISLNSKMQMLRIENNTIELIDKQDLGIEGLDINLGEIFTDKNNNLYVSIYSSTEYDKILKHNGTNWVLETLPVSSSGYGRLTKDSQNRLWIWEYMYNDKSVMINQLFYLNQDSWVEVDVSGIDAIINCLEADKNIIYLGTTDGIKTISIN